MISACDALGFVAAKVSGGVVVHLKSWSDFKSALPPVGAKNEIDLYNGLIGYLKKMAGNDFAQTIKKDSGQFTIWNTGTIRYTVTIVNNERVFSSRCVKNEAQPEIRATRSNKGGDAMFRRVPGHFGGNQ